MTDNEVVHAYLAHKKAAFSSTLMCAKCGETWAQHIGMNCRINYGTPGSATTFIPAQGYGLPGQTCHGLLPRVASYPKHSFTADHAAIISHFGEIDYSGFPHPITKKIYINECPCGIHPSRCDYHR